MSLTASESREGDTLSERAAAFVQRDILAGLLAPGTKLGIVELAERYEIGATPLREGLSRLVSRGLIVAIGQRGFRVAPISREDLLDITRTRVLVEMEALRLSMKLGDDTWEAGIMTALHRLRRHTERLGARFREGGEEGDLLHKEFHTALLAACNSPRLLAAHSDLYDQAYRYRRLMMRNIPDGKRFYDSHRQLADLVLARDAKAALKTLSDHLYSTMRYVYPDGKERA
ncbi:MAG: GntR family transcriptional regulator [Proteobacteria bacterium SG_bin9]|nr:MAG: GntR family transcriptional regulator [Proteobacteria bacterium SG_bin9]